MTTRAPAVLKSTSSQERDIEGYQLPDAEAESGLGEAGTSHVQGRDWDNLKHPTGELG